MILRKCLIGIGVALVAFAPIACSSDNDADSAPANGSAAASESAGHSHDVPSAQVLQDNLALLVDPAKPAADKVAGVVNGNTRIANYEKLTAAMANYPVTFAVKDVTLKGHDAAATVDVGSPHGSMPMPMTWENVDGQWKLSDTSSCQLLAMGQAPCQ